MGQDSVENYEFLYKLTRHYIRGLQSRNLATLRELKSSLASRLINRLDYSPQTARCAEWDGADIEVSVAALIHNIGNALALEIQCQVSATIIQPFSLDEVTWKLQMHGLFQMYYYADKLGLKKDFRNIHSEHKSFNLAVDFCQK